MKNLSMRARLSLLVTVMLCLTVGPLLYVTYRSVNATTLTLEQQAFAAILTLEEESVNTSYLNLLASKVSSVMERKTRLAAAARQARALIRDQRNLPATASLSEDARQIMMDQTLLHLASDSLWLERLTPAQLSGSHANRLGLHPDLTDAKGRPLDALLAKLPDAGDFAVFHLPLSLEKTGRGYRLAPSDPQPVLMFFLRDDVDAKSGTPPVLYVAMSPLTELEEQAAAAERAVIRMMEENFHTLNLYQNGFIALLDGRGQTLAFRGKAAVPDSTTLEPYLTEARRQGRSQAVLNLAADSAFGSASPDHAEDDMLYLFGYTPAFDWHLVVAAPVEEIRAPSDTLLSHLLILAGTALVVSLAAALFMLARALRPLDILTRKTEALPAMDFSSPETEARIAHDLPRDRGDEVGRLARAFASMGTALSQNIRALMETTASKERMEGELNAAREIQLGILPPPDGAPQTCGFTASAFLDPAKEVGGDLYDYVTLSDGRYALVLGDVSGKGVPAALFMSMTVTLVRYALRSGLDPAAAMNRVNEQLEEHNPGNMFVTLFLALYDPETGDLQYANGGHCPPYVTDGAGGVRTLEGLSGPMVGVLPDMAYTLHHDRLEQNELCLLFTDGVTEAMKETKELYGEERLTAFLARHGGEAPKTLLAGIFADLVRYRGDEPQSDDITMLAFARRSEGTLPEAHTPTSR